MRCSRHGERMLGANIIPHVDRSNERSGPGIAGRDLTSLFPAAGEAAARAIYQLAI